MFERVLLYALTVLLTHYLAALIQAALHGVIGHHPIGGSLYRIHAGDHHTIYRPGALMADSYSDEERSLTTYYLVPAAGLVAFAYRLLPHDILLVHVVAFALSMWAHTYLHVRYHLTNSWLQPYRWFTRKQELHFEHHRNPSKNFAVIEFVWDRVFGTYQPPRSDAR